jgi:hypothetical protein
MSVRPDLARPVHDLPTGKVWIERLIALGLMFHFEDAPESIVNIQTGQPIFDPEEAAVVRARVAALYRLDWGAHGCPLGYAMSVEAREEAA